MMLTLVKIYNDKGVSYCINCFDKKDKSYHNIFISYAEFVIFKESFEKLGYKVIEKDFRK